MHHVFKADSLVEQVSSFIRQCQLGSDYPKFASAPGGPETLYASCFACMLYHYLGYLDNFSVTQRQKWADYLNSWQDPKSGYFVGPELVPDELRSRKHTYEHIAQHLAAHVLPALTLLSARPKYPLAFASPFTELNSLKGWLEARDWRDAWLEGNNLIFVGQFLIHLRDVENLRDAQSALELYFDWLNKEMDPATGLWGSNGYCSNAAALYGGYHQLLVYYYEDHPVRYPERLVDVALSLQHADGGFNPAGGGGACEDTDAIDILVNMYKRADYKHPQIRIALRKALRQVLNVQMPDGGFVYRLNQPFMHMGVQKTASPQNQSNLFPTWFRVHTLALISEILTDEPIAQRDWQFNHSCSMGWHRPWDKSDHALRWQDRQVEHLIQIAREIKWGTQKIYGKTRRIGGKVKRRLWREGGYV